MKTTQMRKKDAVVLAAQIRPRERGNEKGRERRWNPYNRWSPYNQRNPLSKRKKRSSIQDYDHICKIKMEYNPEGTDCHLRQNPNNFTVVL